MSLIFVENKLFLITVNIDSNYYLQIAEYSITCSTRNCEILWGKKYKVIVSRSDGEQRLTFGCKVL